MVNWLCPITIQNELLITTLTSLSACPRLLGQRDRNVSWPHTALTRGKDGQTEGRTDKNRTNALRFSLWTRPANWVNSVMKFSQRNLQSQMSDSAPARSDAAHWWVSLSIRRCVKSVQTVLPPIELLWIYSFSRSPFYSRSARTWRHPRNRKYTEYRNDARKGPSHGYNVNINRRRFGRCARGETHRHTNKKPRCVRSSPALLGRWPRLVLASPTVV